MKIVQLSDIHYSDKHLEEVDRCMCAAIAYIEVNEIDLIVLSGDTFDHRLEQNSPALLTAIQRVRELSQHAPVLILQGTLSHDAPHAVDLFTYIKSRYLVYVASRIEQVVFANTGFVPLGEFDLWANYRGVATPLVISCLPSINKGQVAASVGAENAAHAVGDYVADLLRSWAPLHLEARAAGIPSIIVTHGTVNGAVTEHGVPMAGFDHEYGSGALFAAEASAVMVGHIHKHQAWEKDGRLIAYPGSLGRLHFGEHDPKGFLVWEVDAHGATFEFIPTPARELLEVTFPGSPDMDELARIASEAPAHAHVRIRYVIDAEHRDSVDKAAITALFSGHAAVKIEGRIAPISRQRSAGIGKATSLNEKLLRWCEVTGTASAPLMERLEQLQAGKLDVTEDAA